MSARTPSYRHHRPTSQAVVTLGGRDHYLGKYGTPKSRELYHRLLAEWVASRQAPPAPADRGIPRPTLSVNELILAFWRHGETHYRRADGSPTGELDNFRDSLRPLRKLYGGVPAVEVGPLALKSVRQAMISAGLARSTINQRIGRIVHVYKWAVENELLPPSAHQALKAVAGLQKGRTVAREAAAVRPIPEAHVEAIRSHVTRQVWAMVELQRLTGMRPGEITIMRGRDLDMSGAVWTYTPGSHKGEHHGKVRVVYLGPRAQEVVKPWLRPELTAYLFSPREAMAEFRTAQRAARTTPLYPSTLAKSRGREPLRLRDHYSVESYHHSVRNACLKAGVPRWHPHQLRHNAATRLRKEFGLDTARAILGHSDAGVTEVYAELDREKASAVMAKVG